jgi:uncharacterized ferritin-like protein (DUF455 family)
MQPLIWTATTCRHELAPTVWLEQSLFAWSRNKFDANQSGPLVGEWSKALRSLEEHAKQVVDVLAEAIILDPALRMKFAFGLLMPTVAYAYASFGERSELFGEPPHEPALDLDSLRNADDSVPAPRSDVADLRMELTSVLQSLAAHAREVADITPFAWDEATRGEALKLAAVIDAASREITEASAGEETDTHPDVAVPSRSARLTIAPLGVEGQVATSPKDKSARGMHNFLFEAEIGALELCAENILLARSMPRDFTVDMAVQCFDEARHATALLARLATYGRRDDSYPASLKFWNRSRGLSVPQRLAVHQRIGEWIGVDSLIAGSSDYLARGDQTTSALLQFMARDEIRHVGYGNKWLRWFEDRGVLNVAEIDRWADEYRGTYGSDMASVSALPVNVRQCLDAGFTAEEVERLKRARGQSLSGLVPAAPGLGA